MKLKHVNSFLSKIFLMGLLLLAGVDVAFAQVKKSNKKIKFCTNLELALQSPESITHLKLRGMELDSVPDEISQLENLVVLDLSKNNIQIFDQTLLNLPSLVELNLSKNLISEIPESIDKMDLLQRLIVNQNPISIIPNSIVGCRSLEYIDAWGTEIDQLDSALTNAPKLEVIDLQSIRMGNKTQQAIVDNMKGKIKVKMSASCDCD